jgi:3-oxoacyl-(acyl-carrier-protein) synthase
LLEEYEHAKLRDEHVYCEVAGYSLNNNAFLKTGKEEDEYASTSPKRKS